MTNGYDQYLRGGGGGGTQRTIWEWCCMNKARFLQARGDVPWALASQAPSDPAPMLSQGLSPTSLLQPCSALPWACSLTQLGFHLPNSLDGPLTISSLRLEIRNNNSKLVPSETPNTHPEGNPVVSTLFQSKIELKKREVSCFLQNSNCGGQKYTWKSQSVSFFRGKKYHFSALKTYSVLVFPLFRHKKIKHEFPWISDSFGSLQPG